MKIKVSVATNNQLNWLVAMCECIPLLHIVQKPGKVYVYGEISNIDFPYQPSTDWYQGGPIIEREQIATQFWTSEGEWEALIKGGFFASRGPSPLIAAMRCYVTSKLGEEVEVPNELCK